MKEKYKRWNERKKKRTEIGDENRNKEERERKEEREEEKDNVRRISTKRTKIKEIKK